MVVISLRESRAAQKASSATLMMTKAFLCFIFFIEQHGSVFLMAPASHVRVISLMRRHRVGSGETCLYVESVLDGNRVGSVLLLAVPDKFLGGRR